MLSTLPKRWLILIGVGLSSFLGCIDFTIVNTALPTIQNNLHASMNQLQWIINGFLLALSVLMILAGRLGDLYGSRRILFIGMAVFGLSSLGAGLSANIPILLAFRLLQGMSTAILYTIPTAIVSQSFPIEQRGKALGMLYAINGIGLAIGPVLGGIIVGTLGWRWIFIINAPLIIISFTICLPNIKPSPVTKQKTPLDGWGLTLLALGLTCLIIALIEGDKFGWNSPQIMSLFVTASLCLLSFYQVEKRSQNPIMPLHLFTHPQFIGGVVASSSLGFYYVLAFFFMPLFLHNVLGYSNFQLGFILLPTTIMMAALSPLIGKATDHFGPKPILIVGALLFIFSASLQLYFTDSSPLVLILVAFAIMGIGWAACLGPSTVAALQTIPTSNSGVATGILFTLHNIGGTFGLALGSVLYHIVAAHTLINKLSIGSSAPPPWVTQVVAKPNQAIDIIQAHTRLAHQAAVKLFHTLFLHGYHSIMVLLIVVTTLALLFIYCVMPEKRSNEINSHRPTDDQ